MYTNSTSGIIEKALHRGVTSENIGDKLDLEEIIYINRVKNILNYFSIESILCSFINLAAVPESYAAYLYKASKNETALKQNTDGIMREAMAEIPQETAKFVVTFLAKALCCNYEAIRQDYNAVLNNPKCAEYIKNLEMKLSFDDPIRKTNIIRYIRKKYAAPVEYFYADLISNIAHSDIYGLLYILYDL